MNHRSTLLIGVILLFQCLSFVTADEAFEKSKMIGEIETIKNIFDYQYAPKDWKKKYFGWDLEQEFEKAKQAILNTNSITIKDFQIIVRNFFRSTRDYHVKVAFISTETAFLPIEVKGVNGRYFITFVDRSLLSIDEYPIQTGDEILLFDGRPVGDVIEALQMDEFGTFDTGTDRSITEHLLTYRSGILGQQVPRGPVAIQVHHLNNHALTTYQLIWTYKPEKVTSQFEKILAKKSFREHSSSIAKIHYFNKPWMTPYYKPFGDELLQQILYGEEEEEEPEDDLSPFAIGGKYSFVPTLGRIWWNNDKKYWNAYVFETPDHKLVGYLRIPHYNYKQDDSSMEELKQIIQLFEERTDALVIDQVNNPGGLVFYMYAVASLLTEQALTTPRHRIAITHEDVYHAADTISTLEFVNSDKTAKELFGSNMYGYPISYQFTQHWLEFCRFISDQWGEGKKMTDPYHLYGVDHINPNPKIRYTKPILFLINELDFSCADFLPAILQDNKRARIMGTQTSGAGGCVLTNAFKSRFGIAGFRITGSIAERNNKQPIENLGITPDIHYELTEEDYQYGFQGYKKAVLENLNDLLH